MTGGSRGKLCWALSACPFCVGLTVLAGVVAAPYMTLADGPPPTYIRLITDHLPFLQSHKEGQWVI